jgi:hypothetical protein
MRDPTGSRQLGPALPPTLVAAGAGAVWGVVAFQIMWGYTSIVVTRPFVNSLPGLIAFLPVRLVLFGIRFAEVHVAGHPFDFSRNHAWIGLVSAAAGALLLWSVAALVKVILGRRRPETRAEA